ncbi:helix-turn-helix domain-containing protein [Phytohabitans rumicis]|uniref:XRE family transcriptional regulator n=1 Tax=Phytohabitans rumicis TaxID=1076125 RepID=A0A6V8LEP4_9ACTN|nr:helix-turn-helix domain-containing protein [Phytohabitans rumicis]GFJ93291.1 XRE family transcriptional regulator [Phytohabitans rumicis]
MATTGPATNDGEPALNTLADRLNYLFRTIHPADRGPYTLQEVADAVEAAGGHITAQYINHLRTGVRDNPTIKAVTALADFFGVPPGYLLGDGDTAKVTEELQRLRTARDVQEALSDPNIRTLALRARELSEPHLKLVLTMLDQVQQLEGKPPPTKSRRQATGP